MIRLIFHLVKKPLLILIVFVIIVLLMKRMDVFKNGLFTSKPLVIDKTPLVIKEIKTIAELNTATYYQEIVVDSIAPAAIPFAAKRELVLIIKGKVTAGIDLQSLRDENVFAKDDSVHVSIPSAVIRDVIINPGDVETFYEFGRWTNAEVTRLKLSGKNKLHAAALRSDLLKNADAKAKLVMETFLKAAGFRIVLISRKDAN